MLALSKIRTDGGTQSREELSAQTIADYAECVSKLPPVVVFYDGEVYWLADGFHRHAAHNKAGRAKIAVEVKQGSRRDAQWYSLGANSSHGLQRSNADKRRAVERALNLLKEDGRKESDRWIADRCGVGHQLVATVRSQLDDSSSSTPKGAKSQGRTQGKDGKWRKPPTRKPNGVGATLDAEDTEDEPGNTPTTWTCEGCGTAFPGTVEICGHCVVDDEFVPELAADRAVRAIDLELEEWPAECPLDALVVALRSKLHHVEGENARRRKVAANG